MDNGVGRLLVTSETHFVRDSQGRFWGVAPAGRAAWTRYLDVFDSVRVAARTEAAPRAPVGWVRVDGDRVSVLPLPSYRGVLGYARAAPEIGRVLHDAIAGHRNVLFRVPSPIAALGFLRMSRRQVYGVEVVGDPHDVLAPGAIDHPLRPMLRAVTAARLRQQCGRAAVAVYVTRNALQARYPPGPCTKAYAASNVELADADFADLGKRAAGGAHTRLVTVGSMAQMYKGIDVLLEAVAVLRRLGIPLELYIVGDGRYRAQLEALASGLGISEQTRFLGELDRPGVRETLRSSDIFVMPSRTEGLPRALVEGMAAGLACVGTDVGGIPELLPASDIVPANDAAALAKALLPYCQDENLRAAAGRRNQAIARGYSASELQRVRNTAYAALRAASARNGGRS